MCWIIHSYVSFSRHTRGIFKARVVNYLTSQTIATSWRPLHNSILWCLYSILSACDPIREISPLCASSRRSHTHRQTVIASFRNSRYCDWACRLEEGCKIKCTCHAWLQPLGGQVDKPTVVLFQAVWSQHPLWTSENNPKNMWYYVFTFQTGLKVTLDGHSLKCMDSKLSVSWGKWIGECQHEDERPECWLMLSSIGQCRTMAQSENHRYIVQVSNLYTIKTLTVTSSK